MTPVEFQHTIKGYRQKWRTKMWVKAFEIHHLISFVKKRPTVKKLFDALTKTKDSNVARPGQISGADLFRREIKGKKESAKDQAKSLGEHISERRAAKEAQGLKDGD